MLLKDDVSHQLDQSGSSAHQPLRRSFGGDRGLAQQAVEKYVAERMSKRARGIDVPVHRGVILKNLLKHTFAYAGQRKVNEQSLILLRQGTDILVLALPSNWQGPIKNFKLGHEIKIGANGQIQARVNQL